MFKSRQFIDRSGREQLMGQLTWVVLAVLAVVVVYGLVDRYGGGGGDPAPVTSRSPLPVPVPVEPLPVPTTEEPSDQPSPPVSAEPSPSVTATVDAPAQTVLFMGGPARGPWQQIGTVAEITHPGAPSSASFSYRMFWSDPEGENMPDFLWDQITQDVAQQAMALGSQPTGTTFGGAPGSEPFNSFAGVEDVYVDQQALTAIWQANFVDEDGTAAAHWGYVIDFDFNILRAAGPLIIRESEVADFDERSDVAVEWMRGIAAEEGLGE